jgi:hypothetical protein
MITVLRAAALAIVVMATSSTASRADCTVSWLCLEKTPQKDTNMQAIVANRTVVAYKPDELKSLYYADLKIKCSSSELESFARQFVDKAWNAGLLTAGREFALTVDIEKIRGGDQAATALATYLIAQVKRDAGGNTTVTGCDDFIATNINFNTPLRLKFKLLQSKTTTVNPAAYSAFRLVSQVLGFVAAGPSGTALIGTMANISTKVAASQSDIDDIAKMFDEVNTQKPQTSFDATDKSVTLTLADNSRFTIERIGKRSAFLTFDGARLNAPGAPLQGPISDHTGIDLASYLTTKAGGWDSLLISSDETSARSGCLKIRSALGDVFTSEEAAVILGQKLAAFDDQTIIALKDPCLKGIEREALKTMGVPDPLAARPSDMAPSIAQRDPSKDATDPIRWSAIREFLNDFGLAFSTVAAGARDGKPLPAKLAVYFDDRVATQSFDVSDLMPSSDGVPKETLSAKIAAWPFGSGGLRYGCFLPPDRTLATKYAAQMLIAINPDTPQARLLNLVIGFTDPNATDADKLNIGNLMLENATAGTLANYQKQYASGCGDRSDPWKPWSAVLPKTSSAAVTRFAERQ